MRPLASRFLGFQAKVRADDDRLFGYTLAGGVLAFFLWSALFPLDTVSSAQGEVIPASHVKLVQHLEGGIVSEIYVKEGEAVTREQPLVALESTASSADAGESRMRIGGLMAEVVRLQAEAAGHSTLRLPAEVPAQMAREAQALFASRRANLQASLRAQQEVVVQREHAIREISARLSNTKNALKFIQEQVSISEKLLKEEITSRMEHLALQREESSLKSRLEEDQAMIKRLEASIAESRAQLSAIQQGYMQQVNGDLARAGRELSEVQQRTTKHTDMERRAVLRAPVDGVVKVIHVTTQRGVVQPGQTVVEVVPSGDMLVVEAKLPVQEIGYVREGQLATVRLSSSDAGRFGKLDGKVVHISPDSITTDKGAFYKVRVETRTDHFRQGASEYRLVPGVRVVVSIVTGERTVLGYLMAPFTAGVGQALQER
jgi:adhesin transport system membrane fusion protein